MNNFLDPRRSFILLMLGIPPCHMSSHNKFIISDLIGLIPCTLSDCRAEYSLSMFYEEKHKQWTVCHYNKDVLESLNKKVDVYDKDLTTALGQYLINLIENKLYYYNPIQTYDEDDLNYTIDMVITMHMTARNDISTGQEINGFNIFCDYGHILLFHGLDDTIATNISYNKNNREYKIDGVLYKDWLLTKRQKSFSKELKELLKKHNGYIIAKEIGLVADLAVPNHRIDELSTDDENSVLYITKDDEPTIIMKTE